MSFLRIRQPAITRLNPHPGNRRYLIRNGFGQATSTLTLGLVTQADCNTRGRSDDLPFDHVLGNVGTAFNGAVLGAAGDGGFFPMDFVKASSQYITLPPVPGVTDNDFLQGDFTIAARFKSTSTLEMACVAFAPTALCGLKVSQNNGDPQAFCIDDGSQATNVPPATGANSNDGLEHVLLMRRAGNRVQMVLSPNGVIGDVTGNYGNGGTTTTNLQQWATFFDDTPIIFLEGSIFWSAAWDRLLTNDELAALTAKPNPFV